MDLAPIYKVDGGLAGGLVATEAQYNFFRNLYDEENQRHVLLEGRAKVYISILTFYVGAIAFKADDVVKFLKEYQAPVTFAVVAGVAFVFALACCVFSVRIKTYEALADPEELIAQWPDGGMKDEVFLDARIADLAVATNRNAKQNDESARALEVAGWLLVAGVLIQATAFVVALSR